MQTMECNAFLRSGVTTLLFEKRDGWEATDQSVARVLANIWSTAVAMAKSVRNALIDAGIEIKPMHETMFAS